MLVDGVDLSTIGLVEGLEISRRSDEAISTARVMFQQRLQPGDKFHQRTIAEWSHIQIVEDTAIRFPRFGGYIAEITREAQDNEKYRADCRCVDYGVLFERKISSQLFTNARDQDIAIALSVEGGIPAPAENVDFTNILAEFDARDLTVREALERLCEITGCRWHVDTSKTFRYHKPGLHFNPFNLSDTPDFSLSYPYQMLSCNREFSTAANRMLFLGGPDESGAEVRVTREDTASQAQYGVIEAVKVDRSIAAASVAQLMLDAELSQRSLPRVSGRVLVREPVPWGQLIIGSMIGVKSSLYGLNANYQIYGLRMFIDNRAALQPAHGRIRPAIACEMEFGRREADIVSTLRILSRKDTALPQAVIDEDTMIPAENIVGVIGGGLVSVAAEVITGSIQAGQIGSVYGESITGSIGGPGSTVDVHGQSITGAITGEDVTIGATHITGVIVGAQLTDQILDTLRLVGPGMGVVERIPSSEALPALPHLEYPDGSTVMWNAVYGVSRYGTARYGSVLYEASGASWIPTSASAKLTGILKYSDIESIQAQQITGLIIASQIQNIKAEQITGVIQGDQIGTINATSITAVNSTAITGPISAQNITVLNAGDITMVSKWTEGQIQSVSASSITAGTISATVKVLSPDVEITVPGEGYKLYINTTVGMKVTATGTTRTLVLTESQLRISSIPGAFAGMNEGGIEAQYPGGFSMNIGASPTTAAMGLFSPQGGISLTCPNSGAVGMVMTGTGSGINLAGANSWIFANQYRFFNAGGGLTVVSNPSKSINVYDNTGALLGRVPVY